MDNTQKSPTVLSFCTGYGGIERGLELAGIAPRILAHVEIEAFAIANLVHKMETSQMAPAPIWTNVKTLPLEPFRDRVDLLTGGYPCQPFSAAGKRLGDEDPRHLWPHIRKAIDVIRPRWCFFENVEGHISMGLSDVIEDLGRMGYRATWGIFSAEEVGAPHRRKRVFILAHSGCVSEGSEILRACGRGEDVSEAPGIWPEEGDGPADCGQDMANTHSTGQHTSEGEPRPPKEGDDTGRGSEELGQPERTGLEGFSGDEQGQGREEEEAGSATPSGIRWPSRPGTPQHGWEEPRVVADTDSARIASDRLNVGVGGEDVGPEDPEHAQSEAELKLGRTANGPSNRVDRLRLLGNGVVPMTAAKAFVTLMKEFE